MAATEDQGHSEGVAAPVWVAPFSRMVERSSSTTSPSPMTSPMEASAAPPAARTDLAGAAGAETPPTAAREFPPRAAVVRPPSLAPATAAGAARLGRAADRVRHPPVGEAVPG